ncbi:glycosyltransferase family 4 protein [Actinomarinicola tropica]|uniref:Glycosyltransferase n=1 Tax=Actinomarinicola tropica TaxID=2789776 RepID=A0A5Q2RRJ9_9ACTN|nr:glycosyltransferase family 1 protein [Actinomarinicola tropica]QGG95815.1 glycosyltransferase [Actinomarinicola tropica]
MTLRVALDATPLLGARTGVGVFTLEVLRHLPATGVDVLAYATSWRGRHLLGTTVPPGVRVARRPQAARPLRELWRRGDRPPIEWWTGAIDVVHGTNFVVPPTRRAAQVVSIHDLTFHHHPEMSTRHTLEYPGLIRWALARGAWVHADTRFGAEEIVDVFGADPERVVTVPLGVSPVPEAEVADGRALAGGDRFVLAVGTVEPRKDLPGLVDAFDALAADDHELRLVLAGPDGWAADQLTARVARSPHRARIVRLGWVDDLQRAALLRAATVLAYPSRYEGFGLPPLEAMSVGTPVVTTAVGPLPEVLGDAAAFVPAGDPDDLAGAIAVLLDDEDERARRRAAGLERAASYTWAACAEGLSELYRRAASAR